MLVQSAANSYLEFRFRFPLRPVGLWWCVGRWWGSKKNAILQHSSFLNKLVSILSYDDKCEGQNICNINIPITDNMTAPIFVYYKLDNFYQNHRSFVKSINFKQIRAFDGMESGEAERVAKSCTPDIYKYPMNGLQEDQRNKTL